MITNKLYLICINKLIFLLITFLISASNADVINNETIDCKTIDETKFNEIFKFKFGGGSLGLYFDFDFSPKNSKEKFKVSNCEFKIKDTKISEYPLKSVKKPKEKNKLGGLKPCVRYDVTLTIENLASKKDFIYKNKVYTKIDKPKLKLSLKNQTSNSAKFEWKLEKSESSCILSYNIKLMNSKNESYEVIINDTEKTGFAQNLQSCDVYTAKITALTARDEKISSDTLSFPLLSTNDKKEDIIKNLKVFTENITNDSVNIRWTSDSTNCLQDYKIELFDSSSKLLRNQNTFENSLIINHLSQCKNYSIVLKAVDQNKNTLISVNESFTTHLYFPLNEVEVVADKLKAEVKWPKLNDRECILDYSVTFKKLFPNDDSNSQKINNIDRNSYKFKIPQISPNEEYDVTFQINEISYKDHSNLQKQLKTVNFNTLDRDKFRVKNIVEFRNTISKLQISWNLEMPLNHFLDHYRVLVNEVEYVTNKTFINLSIVSCRMNYTLIIQCVDKRGFIGDAASYQTNLKDSDFELSPFDDNIHAEQAENEIIISWTPMKDEASCISHYEIGCNDQLYNTSITKHTFTDFLPCITYEIFIIPYTLDGLPGARSVFEYTAKEIVPNQPKNLKLVQSDYTSLTLSVEITQYEKYCMNTIVEFHCNDQMSQKKIEIIEEEYHVKVENLSPSTEYSCYSKVKNSIGVSPSSEVQLFNTKKDAPLSPIKLKSQVLDDNAIELSWQSANSIKNSEIYELNVTLTKILYQQTNNCSSINFKSKFFSTEGTSYVLNNLVPFSKYSVSVKSISSSIYSEPGPLIYFQTKSAKPSEPRDLKVIFFDDECDHQHVRGQIKWKTPCQVNGNSLTYLIHLVGTRKHYDHHIIIEESAIEQIEIMKFKRGYNYNVHIKAKNQKFIGDNLEMDFNAPSGVPSEVPNALKVDFQSNLNGMSIDVFVSNRAFTSNVGDITGTTFLIFNADCDEKPSSKFGYKDANKEEISILTETINLECSKLYQQTELISNPLDRHLNDSSSLTNFNEFGVKYTIGSGRCEEPQAESYNCNPPLPQNMRMGLILRIFTEKGFRDSDIALIEFQEYPQISSILGIFKPIHIVLATVILIVVLTIITLICCCACDKRRHTKKHIEPVEADENLLSFTSYCVIDRHPVKHSHV